MFKKLFKILLIIFIIFLCVISMGGAAGAFAIACSDFLVAAGFPVLGSLITSVAAIGLPWYVATAIGIGLGYLVWPEATSELISDIGTVVEKVGSTVASVVGSTASTLLGSFLTGPGGLILLGVAAYFFLGGRSKRDDEHKAEPTAETPAGVVTQPYAEAK